MFEFIGPLVSAASSLFGGALNRSSQESINQQQLQFSREQAARQWELATQGIQYRVADAKAAGVHPLFALGASTSSYTPVSSPDLKADTSLGQGIANMGQDLGRAFSAMGTRAERQMQLAGATLDLERKQLENDTLRMGIASKARTLAQPGNPPGFPVAAITDPKIKQEESTSQLRILGKNLVDDPLTSQGQTFEDVLGEGPVSDTVGGISKTISLVGWNALRNALYSVDRNLGRQLDNWAVLNLSQRGARRSLPIAGDWFGGRVPLPPSRR